MKHCVLVVAVICSLPLSLFAENRHPEEGTIVRMRMADCASLRHSFMSTMSGGGQIATGELCPEYVLLTSKVVYVIVGKGSDQIVPLAETTIFRIQNGEVVIRVDDARRESHFHVKEMALRPEWERDQRIEEAQAMAAAAAMSAHRQLEGTALVSLPQ